MTDITHVAHLYRGELFDDLTGRQQVLITIWTDGAAEIATRLDDSDIWSPPNQLEEWPHD